jgi:hypothetical protein
MGDISGSIIVALATGVIVGVNAIVTNYVKRGFKKEVDTFFGHYKEAISTLQRSMDERHQLMIQQLNSLSENVNKIVAIEKESAMTKELLYTHIEDNKRSIERIHDRLDDKSDK